MSATRHRLTALAALIIGGLAGFVLPVPAPEDGLARTRRTGVRPASDPRVSAAEEIAATSPAEQSTAWAEQWARKNPHAFLSWLLKCEPQPGAPVVEAFFAEWIILHPDAAFTAAGNLPGRFGYGREHLFFVKQLEKLFRKNPEAAFRWVGRVEGIIGGGSFDPLSPQDLSALDPDNIAQILRRTAPGPACTRLTEAFAAFLTKRDRAFALQWAESLPVAHCAAALGPVLREWFSASPSEVMDYLAGASSSIRQGFGTVWSGEVLKDHPQEALDWMEKNMGHLSFGATENSLAKFGRKDQAAATAYALQIAGPQIRVSAIRGLTETVTFGNKTSGAIAWINTLPDEAKLTAFGQCMSSRMLYDFGDFFNYLKDHAGDDLAADYAGLLGSHANMRRTMQLGMRNVTRPLRQGEVEQLIDWAGTNPGPVSDRLVTSVFTALSSDSRGAAKVPALLDRLPEEQRALAVSVSGK